MIHPNMATMLAYVTTDAAVEAGLMARLARSIADRSSTRSQSMATARPMTRS